MSPRQYLGAGLVTALIIAVAAALAAGGGDGDRSGDDDTSDGLAAGVPTDAEATTPSSVTSVPADEGIDDPLAVIADLSPDQVVPPLDLDAEQDPRHDARFEALMEEPGRLCMTLNSSQPGRTAVHLHIGARGEEGEIYLDLGAVLDPPGDGPEDASEGCIDLDADAEGALVNSTDAFYVDIHTGDHANGALRGQLQTASIFDLQFFG